MCTQVSCLPILPSRIFRLYSILQELETWTLQAYYVDPDAYLRVTQDSGREIFSQKLYQINSVIQ